MRRLHHLQAIIKVVDGHTLLALSHAVVQEENNRNYVIHKGNGYFLITHIHKAIFSVECPGYISRTMEYDIEENSLQSRVIRLYYAPDNKQLRTQKYINIVLRNDNGLLKQTKINLSLMQNNNALRVIYNVQKGDTQIALSHGYSWYLSYCDFRYGDEIFSIDRFDYVTQQYVVSKGLPCSISASSFVHPFWEMQSDNNGNIIIPINALLLNGKSVEISINQKYYKQIEFSSNCTVAEIIMEE